MTTLSLPKLKPSTYYTRNRYFLVLDCLLIPLGLIGAYVLRLETLDLANFWNGALLLILFTVIFVSLTFYGVGIYRHIWRHATTRNLLYCIGAFVSASVCAALLVFVIQSQIETPLPIPRSVPIIGIFFNTILILIPRCIERLARDSRAVSSSQISLKTKRVVIFGATEIAATVARQIRHNTDKSIKLIGFIHDDDRTHHLRLSGFPVLGGRNKLTELAASKRIDLVILADPMAERNSIRTLIDLCNKLKLEVKTAPSMNDIVSGRVKISSLRTVKLEDLLRRAPVQIAHETIVGLLEGKRILVTGAGGSIGSELCRQICSVEFDELVILGHGENSIFEIFHELRRHNKDKKITPVIADLRSLHQMETIVARFRPNVILHAAAHKHVPLMERNPSEAVTNNVIGTWNLLKAANAADVERFVMVSTDKAVNPSSIMGVSKRVAELLVHQFAEESGRSYVAVRFGNVLGSRGSVINTFKKQIASGGPVTITHPDMRRFFMTIPEAVRLILQAGAIGQGGEVFVLDMGKPISILDLASDLITLSGLEVDKDIEIVTIGMRPGEKLFEELFVKGEIYHRTKHEKIFIADNASNFVPENFLERLKKLIHAAHTYDNVAIVDCFKSIVPEYVPMSEMTH